MHWQVGCGMAVRDMPESDPDNQPKLMKDFVQFRSPTTTWAACT